MRQKIEAAAAATLELEISEAQLNQRGLERELALQQTRLKTMQDYTKKVEDELHNSLQHLDSPKELKADFVDIYTKYVIRHAKGQLQHSQPVAGSASQFSLPPPMAG